MGRISGRRIAQLKEEFGPTLKQVVETAEDDRSAACEALNRILAGDGSTRADLGGHGFLGVPLDPSDPDCRSLIGALVRTCSTDSANAIQAAARLLAALDSALPRQSLDIAWYRRLPEPTRATAKQASHVLSAATTDSELQGISSFALKNARLREDWPGTFREWLKNHGQCERGLAQTLALIGRRVQPVLIAGNRVAQIQRLGQVAGRKLDKLDYELPAARAQASAAILACRTRVARAADQDLSTGLGASRDDAPDLHEAAREALWKRASQAALSDIADGLLTSDATDMAIRAADLLRLALAPVNEIDEWRRVSALRPAVTDGPPVDTLLVPLDAAASYWAQEYWARWYRWIDSPLGGRRLESMDEPEGLPSLSPMEALTLLTDQQAAVAAPALVSDPRSPARDGLDLVAQARNRVASAHATGRAGTRDLMQRGVWARLPGDTDLQFCQSTKTKLAGDVLVNAYVVHEFLRLDALVPEAGQLVRRAGDLCRAIDSLHPLAASAILDVPESTRPTSLATQLTTILSSSEWKRHLETSDRVIRVREPLQRWSVEDADGCSKVIAQWCDAHYEVQVVPTAHIDLAIRLRARVKSLSKFLREAAKDVQSHFASVQGERIKSDLKSYPIEKLRDTTQGRLHLTPLVNAGLRTVYDVVRRDIHDLMALPGVGYQTAAQSLTAAGRLSTSLREDMGIRIDLDPGNERTTRLLRSLHAYLGAEDFELVSQVANGWVATYQPALEGRSSDPRLFRSPRDVALPLEAWVGFRPFPGYERVLETGDPAQDSGSLTKDAIWEHFQRESTRYYQALSRITGIPIDIEAEQGYLPAEIAEAVRKFQLDRSLLTVSLREYQVFGAKYALVQRRVLLGDEMGLGKTIQALAVLSHLAAGGENRFLVICPVSVLYNWVREVRQRTRLPVHLLHGTDRRANFRRWRQRGGVAVTSYGYAEHIAAEDPHLDALVVDEAHYIKNPNAQRSRATRRLAERANRVLFMTGTPLENRLAEFVRVIEPLNSDMAAELDGELDYITPKRFREQVAPLYLRRNTQDVLTELPDIVEVFEEVELTIADRHHYLRALGAARFQEMRRAAFVDPESAKLRRLKELSDEAAANGRKVVVFTYFLDVVQAVCRLFGGGAYGPITGQTPAPARQGLIDLFSKADAPAVLVAQIVAGGTGLNIQAASVVVICEPQVKPTLETQAIGRVHRMGQLRSVQVHRLIAADTVDERVLGILHEKRRVFDAFAKRSTMAETAPEAVDISEKALADQVIAEEQARHLKELLDESLMVAPIGPAPAAAPPRRSWANAIREAEQSMAASTSAASTEPFESSQSSGSHEQPLVATGQLALARVAGLVLLPEPEHGSTDVARTEVDLGVLRTFLSEHVLSGHIDVEGRPRKHKCDAVVRLNFEVVPEHATSDNRTVVFVAAPPSDGRTALLRHLGHLYARDLADLDGLLHRIATEVNAPIGCRGWVELHRLEEGGRERTVPTISYPLTSAEEREFGYAVGDIRLLLPDRSTLWPGFA